jgi:hypothetical protein
MTYSSLNRSSPEKIRAWQQRSKPLDRSKGIDRGDPISSSSRLRAKPLPADERARRKEVRLAVYARDRGCLLAYVPGAGDCFGGPTFHHRRKDGQGGAYTEENGACLCAGHNDRLESDADLAALGRSLGLVVRRGDEEYEALGRG